MPKRARFSTFDLLLVSLFSALIIVARLAFRFPLKIPGRSGLSWMAIVVVALGIVPKLGAGSLIGLFTALLAVLLGMGDKGAIYTFFSYLSLGVVADLVAWFLGDVSKPVTGALVGGLGNAAKSLTKTTVAWILGIPTGFVAFGALAAFGTNLAFGIVGGLLGSMILRGLEKAGFFAYLSEKR